MRVLFCGGGTVGHITPAISIAEMISERVSDSKILFIGREGGDENKITALHGFESLEIKAGGLKRSLSIKNFETAFTLIKALRRAKKIIKEFKPMVAVGVGGYASGPTLKMAGSMGIPTLIQEQNSYAGVTNKILAKSACKICVAYEGMERFFPADKIILTGNPVRQSLLNASVDKADAVKSFGLKAEMPTVLIIGGSLGARTINRSVLAHLEQIRTSGVQFIWQTGKFYSEEIRNELSKVEPLDNLHVTDFISNMDYAYAAADLVISRAGASSISELCLLGKPSILVPSPNVAEDHQTKNAMALSTKNAAILIKDSDAESTLISTAIKTVSDKSLLESLGTNAGKMALHDSANIIAKEVYKLAMEHNKD